MTLIVNSILTSALGSEILDWPHRVLALEGDWLWCISLPRRRSNGHVFGYVTGPRTFSRAAIEEALDKGDLKQASFTPPGHWAMRDADYLAEANSDKEKCHREKRLAKRDAAWRIIQPLVEHHLTAGSSYNFAPPRSAFLQQAREHGCALGTVYRLFHLYLANGLTINGLIPGTDRCGAPSTQRKQTRRIGRKPVHKGGAGASNEYHLSSTDKERLARGYQLISATRPAREAYALVSGAFWADTKLEPGRPPEVTLFSPSKRPTFKQFLYWGEKLSGRSTKAFRFGLRNPHESTHRGGSALDLAHAVGQVAMFDSTSTDVYLTSMRSRSIKLPPMTRSLVVDVRSTAYVGFFCGWDPPSSRTALQAIYCAAIDKKELCSRFDVEIAKDDWPGMVFRTYLADNGEFKSQAITEAERQLGFGIEYARAYSGASKGTVETQHHTDHKKFDHRLPGTTRGRRRERGEPHPANLALWNYYEYMRELLLWIIEYNNQEVEHLAPAEMLIAGVQPTRIAIFKWLRDHNQRADIQCDLDQLRALTLPECKAVIQYNGILVKLEDGTRNAPILRFFCEQLRDDERYKRAAAANRKSQPVSVRFQREDISELWLPTSRGLLRVPNVTSDPKARREDTLTDIEQRLASGAESREEAQAHCDQSELTATLRREGITTAAAKEVKSELRNAPQKNSKSSQRKDLRLHAITEQAEAKRIWNGNPPSPDPPPQELTPAPATSSDAAANAVATFLRSLSEGCPNEA